MVSCISALVPPHTGAEVGVPALGSKPRCLLCIDNGGRSQERGEAQNRGPSGTRAGRRASKGNYWCIVNEDEEEGKKIGENLDVAAEVRGITSPNK